VGGLLGECAPKGAIEKKSHCSANGKSGGCEIHKSSSMVHNYIAKVYHSDTLLYQRQQKSVRISKPILPLMMLWNNSTECNTQQPILKAN